MNGVLGINGLLAEKLRQSITFPVSFTNTNNHTRIPEHINRPELTPSLNRCYTKIIISFDKSLVDRDSCRVSIRRQTGHTNCQWLIGGGAAHLLVSTFIPFSLWRVNAYYFLVKTMFYKLIFLEQWMRWRNMCVYLPGRCR